jgi:transposase
MVSLVKRTIKGHVYYYLVWMKRIGKKVVRARQIYLGNADRIRQLLLQPLPRFTSRSYGDMALLLHIAELTCFVEIANKHAQKKASIGDYLLLPVINRLLAPTSKAGISEWHAKTCLPLLESRHLSLSSQNYWHYLGQLDEEKMATIWQELVSNAKNKLGVEDTAFLYDSTNVFTYISEHAGNALPQKGHSKQMRNDKNLLALGLLIGEQSEIPHRYSCYPANVHDSKQFPNTVPGVAGRQKIGKEKITLVFDKGNNSQAGFDAVKDYYFVGALTKNNVEAAGLIDGDFKFCYKNNSDNDIQSVSKIADVYGTSCKIVVSHNKKLEEKQLHSLGERTAKTLLKFEKMDHLFTSEKAAFRALAQILPKKQNPFDYEVAKEGKKFRALLNLNDEKFAAYRKGAGKNIIFTNHLDWSDERIIRAYRSMHKIEHQFMLLHGAMLVPLKPVYHWTDQKIAAHVFLCMVALLFAKTLEFICKGKIRGSFRQILDFASGIRLAVVQKEKPTLVFEDLTPEQQALMEAFSLSRFVK